MRNLLRLAAFVAVAAAVAAPSLAEEPEKVQLALKLEKDANAEFVQTQAASSEATSAQGPMQQSTEFKRAWTATVVAADADGSASVEVKFGRVTGSAMNSMMGAFEFDSDKAAAAPDEADQMAAMTSGYSRAFTALAGRAVTVKVGKDGKVADVAAFDGPAPDAKIAGPARSAEATFSGPKAAQSYVQGCFVTLPEKPAGIGDTWTDEIKHAPAPGVKLAALRTFKVTAIDADSVTMTAEGRFAPEVAPVPPAGGDAKEPPKDGKEPPKQGGGPLAALIRDSALEKSEVKATYRVSRKDGMVLVADASTTLVFKANEGTASAGSTLTQTQRTRVERKVPAPATPAQASPTPPAAPPAPPAPK